MSLTKSGPAYDAEYHSGGVEDDDDGKDYMHRYGPPPTRRDYRATTESLPSEPDTARVMMLLEALRFE